jgi:hypothetical protein
LTERITDSMLESMVEQLNDISKCRYQIGHSYGMVHLEKCSMECTGISMLSQGNTKKELYYQLRTLLDWHSFETRSKQDYVDNCTHLDVFNIHTFKKGEKRNVSHIREYEGKYTCSTCKKEFTEKQYKLNIVPKSADQLRKMRIEA